MEMGLRGFTGTLWEAVWLAKAAQEPFLGCSRLVQEVQGWSTLQKVVCPRLLPGCSRLLQAAPSCSRLLPAAPGCTRVVSHCKGSVAAPGCSRAAPGCSRVAPSCSKLSLGQSCAKATQTYGPPSFPNAVFGPTATPMLPMAALASLPKLPWNYPQAAPRLTYCPRTAPKNCKPKTTKQCI